MNEYQFKGFGLIWDDVAEMWLFVGFTNIGETPESIGLFESYEGGLTALVKSLDSLEDGL